MAETLSDGATEMATRKILGEMHLIASTRKSAAMRVQSIFRAYKARGKVDLLRRNVMAIKVQKIVRQRKFRHQIHILKQVILAKEKVRMAAEDAFVAKGVKAVTFVANEFSRTEFWTRQAVELAIEARTDACDLAIADRDKSHVIGVENDGRIEKGRDNEDGAELDLAGSERDGDTKLAFSRRLFNRYDVDRSGSIDKTELRELLSERANITDKDVADIMLEIDKNEDDKISFNEFVTISNSEAVQGKQLTSLATFLKDAYRGLFGNGDLSYWTLFVTKTLRRRAQVEAEIALRQLFREKRPPSPYCLLVCGLSDDIERLRPSRRTKTWNAVGDYMQRILEPTGLLQGQIEDERRGAERKREPNGLD